MIDDVYGSAGGLICVRKKRSSEERGGGKSQKKNDQAQNHSNRLSFAFSGIGNSSVWHTM